MESSSIEFRLRNLAFTEGLSPQQLKALAAITREIDWPTDATLFAQGQLCPQLHIIERGQVGLEMETSDRGQNQFLTIGPGEMTGWSCLFYDRPMTAAARALEPTRTLSLDARKLRALCDSDTKLGYVITRRILQVVSERLVALRDHFAGMPVPH